MRNFLNRETVLIPYTRGRYFIDLQGKIFERENNCEVKVENDLVTLIIFDKQLELDIAWVMALSFKPVYDSSSFILNWSVLRITEGSIFPHDLIWKPPVGGQICPENPDMKIVPSFSRYSVSETGKIFDREYRRYIFGLVEKPGYKRGYVVTQLRRDDEKVTRIGVHRILCLACLEYDVNVWKMNVNHIDGNKAHNRLSNLEWVTVSYNNIHAMDIGLRNVRKSLLMKDYLLDQIVSFKSISQAAEYIGFNSGYIYTHAKNKWTRLLKDRYIVRHENDPDWPVYSKEIVNDVTDKTIESRIRLESGAFNIFTNECYIADSPGKLAALLGLTVDQVATGVESMYPWPSLNYIFFQVNNPKPILKLTEEEKTAFKDRTGIKNPVKLRHSNGEIKVYVSPSELSVALGLPLRFMADMLYQNKGKYVCDEYEVEYLMNPYSEEIRREREFVPLTRDSYRSSL